MPGTYDFYPRSPCGERLTPTSYWRRQKLFLSTLSLRRATLLYAMGYYRHCHFYPRSPCGERQSPKCVLPWMTLNFYPRSPCGERRATKGALPLWSGISIHALLAESDEINPRCPKAAPNFYPRSPCGERPRIIDPTYGQEVFLSTLSLRRATTPRLARVVPTPIFLSTLSLRRATPPGLLHSLGGVISIHALLAESDAKRFRDTLKDLHFYPRSPCGERLLCE